MRGMEGAGLRARKCPSLGSGDKEAFWDEGTFG